MKPRSHSGSVGRPIKRDVSVDAGVREISIGKIGEVRIAQSVGDVGIVESGISVSEAL